MVSVIIPAHNEESVIARGLGALTAGARPAELQVIVVCNACRDATAAKARAFAAECYPVTVIETDTAGKANALNLGDHAAFADAFPRLYLDADVVLTLESARAIVRRLQRGDVLLAAPTIRMDLSRTSRAVRAFYEIDALLPSHQAGVGGSGVYALSAAGRARFGEFPLITADDAFVRRLFTPAEQARVDDARSLVTPPLTLAGLIAIKTRSHFGNKELARCCRNLAGRTRDGNAAALLGMMRRVELWPKLAIYGYVKMVARLRSKWRYWFADHGLWERDETSRSASVIRTTDPQNIDRAAAGAQG